VALSPPFAYPLVSKVSTLKKIFYFLGFIFYISGMGYVSVFLTISMLIYYSIFAAVPLLFIINSFRPTLPWSCEGLKSWHNESLGQSTVGKYS